MPLYCDEAGNTGSNYLDPDQPIHVLAGWLVPASATTGFEAACAHLAASWSGHGEPKAARRLRSAPGRRSIAQFSERAQASGAHPVCVIVEKKYCVCLKLVETFLDPAHNERASWLASGADVFRRGLADWMLSALPDSVLKIFADAYRSPTIASFDAAIRAVASACRLQGHPELGVAIEGNLIALDELVRVETSPVGGVPQHVAKSINVFTFGTFVQRASSLVASIGMPAPDLIHDESKEFRDALDMVVRFFRAASGGRTTLLESGRPYFGGIDHLGEVEMRKSHTHLALQGADALATVVKELSLSILRDEQPASVLTPILRDLRRRAVAHPEELYWIASTKFAERWLGDRIRLGP